MNRFGGGSGPGPPDIPPSLHCKGEEGKAGMRPCAEKDKWVGEANGTSPLEVPQVNPRTDEVT